MKIKSITWHPNSRLVEITYEDGTKGSMMIPADWGEFMGISLDATRRAHQVSWEDCQPHPYTLYMDIKSNGQAAESLHHGSIPRG